MRLRTLALAVFALGLLAGPPPAEAKRRSAGGTDGRLPQLAADSSPRLTDFHDLEEFRALFDADRGVLPAAGTAGRLARLSSGGASGALVMDDGTQWTCEDAKSQKVIIVTCPPYNAVGDDSNDDTAELQAAFDAIPNTGSVGDGRKVIIPCGVYRISAALTIGQPKQYYRIKGHGSLCTEIKQTADAHGFVIGDGVTQVSYITIQGLSLRDTSSSTTSNAIQLKKCANCTIEDVFTNGWGSSGIFARDVSTYLRVVRSSISNNGGWGIEDFLEAGQGNQNAWDIVDSRLSGNTLGGLHFSSTKVSVRGGAVESNGGPGIQLSSALSSVRGVGSVHGVYFENNSGSGILIGMIGQSAGFHGVSIKGNYFQGLSSSPEGINLLAGSGVSVVGNRFTGHTVASIKIRTTVTGVAAPGIEIGPNHTVDSTFISDDGGGKAVGIAYILGSDGKHILNDVSNANNARGLTIQQETSDDQAFTLKSSPDVGTGLTTATEEVVEADDYFALSKESADQGGVLLQVLAEDAVDDTVLSISSYGGQAPTANKGTTSARALVEIVPREHDGANNLVDTTPDGNIFGVRTRVGGSTATRYHLDEDGDSWQSGRIHAAEIAGGDTPGTSDLVADAEISIFTEGDCLVFAYNDGGTMRFIKLALDGSDVTWTHNTTDPSTGC